MSGTKAKTSTTDTQNRNGVLGIPNSESITKITDWSSEGENSAIDKNWDEKLKRFKTGDVRFTPCVLEFIDAFQGKQFTEKFTIQNVGRNPVVMRIGEPTSFIFQLKKPSRRKIFLAAGASITRTVTYSYHNDDLVQRGRIPIYINGKIIDYHIIVKRAAPDLVFEPWQIDFGTINLGSEVKSLSLTITNRGGSRTKFEIDLGKNDLDLVVKPLKGTVKAKQSVKVAVELMGLEEGEFIKEIWIKTNEIPKRIPVLVEVVRPRLLVVYPNGTEELSAIDFPPAFCGTQKAASFLLKNLSGEITLFVTVGDINGEHKFLNEARKTHEILNFFRLTAEEGRLEPHESRVLTAIFCPDPNKTTKGWHHQEKLERKSQEEYVVFFILSPIHCIERREIENACRAPRDRRNSFKEAMQFRGAVPSFTATGIDDSEEGHTVKEDGFKLCLCGKLVKPEVLLQPSTFYFGDLELGQGDQKVLRITNKSIIRIKCVVLKKSNVIVVPNEHWIGAEKSYEFSLKVTATCIGKHRRNVGIQILGESDVVYATDEPLKVVAEYTVGVFFTVLSSKKVPQPKIGLGITPLITDEVGINKELVTLNNVAKVPYAAKLLSFGKEFEPLWMKMKSTDLNNTLIALPNDRPRGYQVWPKEKICKTIFKGWPRYAPPKDVSYTFSSQERIAKNQNNAIWTNYLPLKRKIREASNKETTEHEENLASCYKKQFDRLLKSELCQESLQPSLRAKIGDTNPDVWNCLVPLSPMYLSYVVVEPKIINYGAVAMDHAVCADLVINNHNDFPTTIKFIPGNAAVTVDEDHVVVQSNTSKTIKVWFQLGILGRYYGFLSYVINTSHQFTITLSAFVIARSLQVESTSLNFGDYPSLQAFQAKSLFLTMKNSLQASISYKFQFSSGSPYYSLLREGEIPPRSTLLSEILVDLDPEKQLSGELIVFSENGDKELLKITSEVKKLDVKFLTNRIDLGDIPLNLKTKVPLIVENGCYHDVLFMLANGSPMPGVKVEPKIGVIKSRSFFTLYIHIQISLVMQFTFTIDMLVQTYSKISAKVTGKVVLPNIKIRPAMIDMRKICAQSFDTVNICIENEGTTPSEIDVDFSACPEYKIINGESHVYLYPKQSTSMVLMFEPTEVSRFVFYLPVIINNILGPPLMHDSDTEYVRHFLTDFSSDFEIYGDVKAVEKIDAKIPLAVLNCTVLSNLIVVSPQSVVFQHSDMPKAWEKSIDGSNDDQKSLMYFPPKYLTISNDGTNDVTFCLRNDDLGKRNDSPFDLKPVEPGSVEYRLKSMKATLKPGQKLEFRVIFSPEKPGNYNVQVPVYVRGYNNGMVYCYITLTGLLDNPKLIPSVDEIHFCPVPLNVTTECELSITAKNYYEVDTITCMICESDCKEVSVAQSLTTQWLETPKVTELHGHQKFPMRIRFKSSKPVGLRCYLIFMDSNKNYCTVLVTAVADNSSVTTHIFLNLNTVKYKIVRHDCEPPVWKADEHNVLSYPFDRSTLRRNERLERRSNENLEKKSQHTMQEGGPILVVSRPWSTQNVGFVMKKKWGDQSVEAKDSNITFQGQYLPSTAILSVSKPDIEIIDVAYPNYPQEEDFYKSHHDNTLHYVERWMYEVVMRCDQYFVIPESFRVFKKSPEQPTKAKTRTKNKSRKQKDVIDFLGEIYDVLLGYRVPSNDKQGCQTADASRLFHFFNKILEKIRDQGCFIPHVRAEHLLPYDVYCCYMRHVSDSDRIRMVDKEPVPVTSDRIQQHTNAKIKQEMDELQKRDSSMLSSEWLSVQSGLDAFAEPPEVETMVEKDDVLEMFERFSKSDNADDFKHTYEILEEEEFEQRSKQAWLDIIIQIFRHSVLKKIVYKSTIPGVQVIEHGDKVPVEMMEPSKVTFYGGNQEEMTETYFSDLYNVQERMLLLWLNHHLCIQRKRMWHNISRDEVIPADKIINNFHKDLCDSVALISVTASYCPFVIPEYFCDCFPKPDTPDKFHHNAARLVQAWRELGIGLSVETQDIVKPNNVFMVMLVAQLYEVLPALHPRYLVCFDSPLSSHQVKKFTVQSVSEKLFTRAKLLGKDSQYFKLSQTSPFEIKPGKGEEIKVTFFAKKIKQVKATLLLKGFELSSHFGKGLTIFLEGRLTELAEFEKLSFSSPLYKVICTEIPLHPAYPESDTYEIWYSTVKPEISENSDHVIHSEPWSEIYSRKVCRRLFLNDREVTVTPDNDEFILSVTVAVLTRKQRCFWLLFRSKIADFLVQLKIKPKSERLNIINLTCLYPDPCPECTCKKTGKDIRTNWTNPQSCPLISFVKLPSRNEELWNALKTMFLKCILPQEQAFWAEFFEKDIGLRIIQWLQIPNEEKEVIDEFVPLLRVQNTYKLSVQSNKILKIPSTINIKDVRDKKETVIPIHVTKNKNVKIDGKMFSEDGLELRKFTIQVKTEANSQNWEESEESLILSDACRPCVTPHLSETLVSPCKKPKNSKQL